MDDILKLKDLCTKYDCLGLDISIKFTKYGIVFCGNWSTIRNYWDNNVFVQDDQISFYKIYEYDLLKSYGIEGLLELFKEEFEYEKEKKEKMSNPIKKSTYGSCAYSKEQLREEAEQILRDRANKREEDKK